MTAGRRWHLLAAVAWAAGAAAGADARAGDGGTCTLSFDWYQDLPGGGEARTGYTFQSAYKAGTISFLVVRNEAPPVWMRTGRVRLKIPGSTREEDSTETVAVSPGRQAPGEGGCGCGSLGVFGLRPAPVAASLSWEFDVSGTRAHGGALRMGEAQETSRKGFSELAEHVWRTRMELRKAAGETPSLAEIPSPAGLSGRELNALYASDALAKEPVFLTSSLPYDGPHLTRVGGCTTEILTGMVVANDSVGPIRRLALRLESAKGGARATYATVDFSYPAYVAQVRMQVPHNCVVRCLDPAARRDVSFQARDYPHDIYARLIAHTEKGQTLRLGPLKLEGVRKGSCYRGRPDGEE